MENLLVELFVIVVYGFFLKTLLKKPRILKNANPVNN